ncbi:hypothetical protein ABZY83_27865 [Streptomyces virginiae]|uniref:hypothetical protein n=1 Tax=Streptomyces TaxID=1883 RepID=UPI0006AFAE57|nr:MULTISPECIES: hypothetical protein [unclassified Streptomyces]KOU63996.1 hypothetical protein ADK96_23330 [Streptomyces sp. IGB124]KOU73116.1 hypothetical protein ADK61_24450 [Streptomyces sp. XY66]KOU87409.1 hypothetical protein ADK93_16750 [Streptomyces sp. XY58]KOV05943.1 hypothetical protein ADK89_17320 [Streptomyces sp. XY37]KOV26705.1 hypothetical protein ADK90_03885 [Streptomyces sp. XY413]
MVQREAVLRLDDQWARVRAGAAGTDPTAREGLLDELIGALRTLPDDPECTALLGLRLADRAALRFAAGDRAGALATIEEGLRSSERAARHTPEYARWYARGLINHGVWLAWPLSDADRLPRHPLGPAAGDGGPSAMELAAGERARDLTRTAVEVWAGLDQADPVNRRGLAQAKVFLGDRLAELGSTEDAVAWAVDAESDFRQLLLADPGAEQAEAAEEALDHIGRQLELRLRYLAFDELVGLRTRGLLPERLLPRAVVAARIRSVAEPEIAARLHLDAEQVRTMLEVTPWLAVWRFDVRGPEGLWNALPHPWHSATEVRNRTAEDVAGELVRGFTNSPDYPGDAAHWRVLLWWQEEGDPAGARFRLLAGPDAPSPTPS